MFGQFPPLYFLYSNLGPEYNTYTCVYIHVYLYVDRYIVYSVTPELIMNTNERACKIKGEKDVIKRKRLISIGITYL